MDLGENVYGHTISNTLLTTRIREKHNGIILYYKLFIIANE